MSRSGLSEDVVQQAHSMADKLFDRPNNDPPPTAPFSFPFKPYPQQESLMQNIYECINSRSIGCFESPTGTGKSLSTICAALTWNIEEETRIIANMELRQQISTEEKDFDWLSAYLQPQTTTKDSSPIASMDKYKEAVQIYRRALQGIATTRTPSRKIPWSLSSSTGSATIRVDSSSSKTAAISSYLEDEFILNPYYSDDENSSNFKSSSPNEDADDGNAFILNDEEDAWETLGLPQIYYCSRTHTQLAQFVSEIKKTPFKNVRCVILGSRKMACIHSDIQKHQSDQSINEKCLDMQNSKVSTEGLSANKKQMLASTVQSKCPYHKSFQEKALANTILNDIHDVEDIFTMGTEQKVCSYYASRYAAKKAQIVCMPYSTLFHSDVRDSMGLKLTDNHVIIIDEAHNLVETLNQINSIELRMKTVVQTWTLLRAYLDRFQSCLHGKNLFYLNLLLAILKKLKAVLEGKVPIIDNTKHYSTTSNDIRGNERISEETICSVNAFLFSASLDNINFLKLRKFLLFNNMVNRIGGFAESYIKAGNNHLNTSQIGKNSSQKGAQQDDVQEGFDKSSAKNDLRLITAFITSLANQDACGRISVKSMSNKIHSDGKQPEKGKEVESVIKYVMLHAAATIEPIFDKVRSVVLLGGTMQPFEYFASVLFPKVPQTRLRFFSCGHIVDKSHVVARVIGKGSTLDDNLEFTHERRNSIYSTTETFNIVLNLSAIIPKGIVVFFTSYQYLQLVYSRWLSSGLIAKLEQFKDVFVESKDSPCDMLWGKYCQCISQRKNGDNRGGILFSVIGGRLSEGINFSDDLARGVIVVGMPYPDTRDPILQEKITHFQGLHVHDKDSGVVINLPENMCMKAVNQAVGRSIRHAGDYAAIVLIDNRYCQMKIQAQLPQWIQDSLKVSSVKECSEDLREFFIKSSTFA